MPENMGLRAQNRVEKEMYQTIQLSSCISIQGELVESLSSGEIIVRDGNRTYRGQPITRPRSGMAGALINAREFGLRTAVENC